MPTITGAVDKDVALVAPCIGVKTAISDHRGSQLDAYSLREIAAKARVGGMLSGKPGLLYVHVGDAVTGLEPLRDVVQNTAIPVTQVRPCQT